MTTKRTFICWHKNCRNKKRIIEEDLIKRVEEEGHIDYCCPRCDSVIICCHEVKK